MSELPKTIPIGRVSIVPKASWSKTSQYTRLDLVVVDGQSYLAIQDVPKNIEITNTTYWIKITSKGRAPTDEEIYAQVATRLSEITITEVGVDPTLSTSGMAADAKAAGYTRSAVKDNTTRIKNYLYFTQGGIKSDTGANADSLSNRVKTSAYYMFGSAGYLSYSVNSAFEIAFVRYTEGINTSYVPPFGEWLSGEGVYPSDGIERYRIVVRKRSGENIIPSDVGDNVIVYDHISTDKSSTISGRAFDAYTASKLLNRKGMSFIDVSAGYIPVNITTVDLNNVTYTGQWSHSVFDCEEGDIFYIEGGGGDAGRLWTFIDSSNKVVLQSAANVDCYEGRTIITPKGASKLIVQSLIGFRLVLAKIKSDFTELDFSEKYEREARLSLNDNKTIITTTEPVNISSLSTNNNAVCSVVKCKEGDMFYVSGFGSTSRAAWAFLDSNKYIVDSADLNESYSNSILYAPKNASWFVYNSFYTIANSSYVFPRPYRILPKSINIYPELEPIIFQDGYITTNGAVGSVVDYTVQSSTTVYYNYAIIECSAFDRFTLNGSGGDLARRWCFVDENDEILKNSIKNASGSNSVIIAPEGASKLILNVIYNTLTSGSATYVKPDIPQCYIGIIANKDNLLYGTEISEHQIVKPNGAGITANDLWYSTNFFSVNGRSDDQIFSNSKIRVQEYSGNTDATYIRTTTYQRPGFIDLTTDTRFLRISAPYSTPIEELYVGIINGATEKGIIQNLSQMLSVPTMTGRANAIARANHFINIKWSPVAPMPICGGSNQVVVLPAGEEQTGVPYSSTRSVCKSVGGNVSLYTFMTALKNPRSVLYTRIINVGTLGVSYYGTVCSVFPSYAFGIGGKKFINSYELQQRCKKISKYAMQPGDILIAASDREHWGGISHCIYVYDVIKDRYGRISAVTLCESHAPYVWIMNPNPYGFDSDNLNYLWRQGYEVYRYEDIENTPYEKSEFVKGFPDEELEDVVYPDIMSEYGDKACTEAGQDVTINVIDGTGYNRINIYRTRPGQNETLIDTKTAITDFIMTNIEYGTYRFELTGPNDKVSNSYLIAADVHGTYNSSTGVVTFSSANATPYAMDSYASGATMDGQSGVQNTEHVFTPAEVSAGQANATGMVGPKFPYVQITFDTEYGTAMWYSYQLTDQWRPWSAT